MYVCVLFHVGFLVKPFAAELTGIRSRVRVDQQVRRQRGRPFERLAALFAFEQLFHVVRRPPTTQPSTSRLQDGGKSVNGYVVPRRHEVFGEENHGEQDVTRGVRVYRRRRHPQCFGLVTEP